MSPQDFLNKEVTVTDWSNYRDGYGENEDYPMKAILFEITDYPCYWVRSTKTGLEFELYAQQIAELSEL